MKTVLGTLLLALLLTVPSTPILTGDASPGRSHARVSPDSTVASPMPLSKPTHPASSMPVQEVVGTLPPLPVQPGPTQGSNPKASTPPAAWAPVGSPSPRYGASMAYDPDIGGIVLFGGDNSNTNYFGDTWVYYPSSQAWMEIFPPDSPNPRAYGAMAYDATDHMVVLFGGYGDGVLYGDTWGLSFTGSTPEWHNMTPALITSTDSPSPRIYSTLSEGPSIGVFLYGGDSYLQRTWIILGDSWNFSVAKGWVEICEQGSCGPTLPGPLAASAMAYSVLLSSDVLFGGFDGSGISNATWVFNSTGWWNITDQLNPSPTGRFFATLVPEGGFLLLSGGLGPRGALRDSDLLDPTTPRWSSASVLTFGLWLTSGAYDPVGGDSFVFGGINGTFGVQSFLWGFDGSAWTPQFPSAGNHPELSWGTGMTYDAADGYVVAFAPGVNTRFPTTWAYASGTWTNITPAVPGPTNSPTSRLDFAIGYDATDAEVILFGGYEIATGNVLSDTWAFKGGYWSILAPGGSPPQLEDASLAPVTQGGPLLLFGGWDSTLQYSSETWEFSGGTWTQLSPLASPAGRASPAMTFDPGVGGILLFGGTNSGGVLSDTWKYDATNDTWVALCTPACSKYNPTGMFNPSLAFDYRDNLTILVGGDTGENWIFSNDNWYFIYWSDPAPGPRQGPLMTWDGSRQDGYLLLWGGYYSAIGQLLDAWTVAPQLRTTTPELSRRSLDSGQQNLSVSATPLGGGNGTTSETWVNLPSGCAVTIGARINCTPNATGIYPIFNIVTTSDGIPSMTGNVTELVVDPPLVLSPLPSANRTWADIGQSTMFSVNASGGTGTYTTLWHGLSSSPCAGAGFTLNCTLESPGNLSISETTIDGNSMSLTTGNLSFPVYPSLEAQAPEVSPNPALTNVPVRLLEVVTGGSGTYTFHWLGLPPGCASTNAPAFNCTPSMPGNYSIAVTVNDSTGADVTSASASLTVLGTPTGNLTVSAHASATSGTAPLPVQFNASAVGGSGSIVFHWAFGDGTTGAGNVVEHTFVAFGSYQATVWANDSLGRSAHSSITVVVTPQALVVSLALTPAVIVLGEGTFLNATAVGGAPGYSYAWSGLPQGCSGSSTATVHCQPSTAGTFNPKVTVSDSRGKTASAIQTLSVEPATAGSSTTTLASEWPLLAALVILVVALALPLLRWGLGKKRPNQGSAGSSAPPKPANTEGSRGNLPPSPETSIPSLEAPARPPIPPPSG